MHDGVPERITIDFEQHIIAVDASSDRACFPGPEDVGFTDFASKLCRQLLGICADRDPGLDELYRHDIFAQIIRLLARSDRCARRAG